jgi:hypothetical protein
MDNMLPDFTRYASGLIGTPRLPSQVIDPAETEDRIAGALSLVLTASTIMCVFYIIMGGINYINSNGDPAKTKAAQQTVTNAIIGLVVCFASFAILFLVGGVLGIKDYSLF